VFVPEWDSTLPTAADRRATTVTRGLDDVADAMRFARVNAPKYGGDSGRVILVGHSLGGAFAMTTTLAGDRFGTEPRPYDASALPDACVTLDGIVPFRETLWDESYRRLYDQDPSTWDKINPGTYMDKSTVRQGVEFRCFVATMDFEDCQAMVRRMRKLGYAASASKIDVGHMEAAQPQTETVAAILELANARP
jgi:pimeloyl-ACP methyl ester carboxylesterase